jgi:predicted PurR-regulated permease PerM
MLLRLKPLLLNIYDILSAVLGPFLIAMVISYVLNPIVNLLGERKVPRSIAVLLIYAAFITSTIVILMNLIPMFIKQLSELNEHLPQFTTKAQVFMSQLNDNRHLPESVRNGINRSLDKMEAGISTWISNYIDGLGNTLNAVFIAFIIPFLSFYILKDFHVIQKGILNELPKQHRKQALRLLSDIDTALGSYIRGQFLVAVIVGVLSWIGYWIIGLPYTLLFASVVSLTNIIPYLGPYFGAAPAMLFAATISWKMILYVILVNWIVQQLEGNVISPQVVGKTLHMHPLTIIFALLVGGELAGIMGLILAVPFFAVMKVLILHFSRYYIGRNTT